ncbi:MAG TPA: sigma 54-interacting transcriptional regulator [Desulfurivibrionaceae bacterium]|nr:sigma 54-interacting transcriptional regulator [Desulfurivibrionaceae bacterium]
MKQKRWTLADLLAILNGLPHGVAILDHEARLLGMNHSLEALTGYSTAKVQGIGADSVLCSHLSHRNPLYRQAVESGGPAAAEGDLIAASRKKIPVRLTVSAIGDGAAQEAGLVVVVEDLSLVKALEKERGGGAAEAKGIIGHSPQLRKVLDFVPVLAHTDATVLITGETGTGKDLLAEAIHHASGRAAYPFIKVNCGALPENLLESELFGHSRGAFTGAHADKPGMFRLAQGGTIFLTEIGDLPLPLQVKLLTVLDDRAFYPLGSSKKVQVDVRVITGTHRNLKELVAQGKFRQDLFFRLNVLTVHLPPLREREGDVLFLADHFLQQFAASQHKPIGGLSPKAVARLTAYGYPGNVRELRNIVEYAVSVCRGTEIVPENLPDYVMRTQPPPKAVAAPVVGPAPSDAVLEGLAGEANWHGAEKRLIMETLVRCKGNRGEAAKVLGWGRSTLWRKIKQHGIG